MRISFLSLLLFCTVSLQAQQIISGGPLKPEQANMDIRHYTLSLQVDPAAQRISGYTEISLLLLQPAAIILLDLVQQMKQNQQVDDELERQAYEFLKQGPPLVKVKSRFTATVSYETET